MPVLCGLVIYAGLAFGYDMLDSIYPITIRLSIYPYVCVLFIHGCNMRRTQTKASTQIMFTKHYADIPATQCI